MTTWPLATFGRFGPLWVGGVLLFVALVAYLVMWILLGRPIRVRSRRPSDWSTVLDTMTAILGPHARTLGARKRVTVVRDPYGVEDLSKWHAEVDHVFEKVLLPALRGRVQDQQLRRGIRAGFGELPLSERWACRGVPDRENEWFHRFAREFIDVTADRALERSSVGSVDFARMTPTEFEHYCADVLRASGWTVTVLGGSGDQGVDLLAVRGAARVAVQCKLYSSPVGNSAVQEAFAGSRVCGADRAYVVTNAGYTPGAYAAAKATGVGLLDIAELAGLDPTGLKKPASDASR